MVDDLFNLNGLTPHGFCLSWRPELFWTMAGADTVIALSYFSISAVIITFVCRRRMMNARWIAALFAAFIMLCAFSHMIDAWTLWFPDYGFQVVEKTFTAIISALTAVLLWPMLPRVLKIPSAAELEARVEERTRDLVGKTAALEASEAKLRGLFELSPLGIARTSLDGQLIEFNAAYRDIVGYDDEELKVIDCLVLTPDNYKSIEAQQLEILQTTGSYGPFEKEYIRKDGTLVPVQLRGMLVGGPDDTQQVWSLVEDISQRKGIEAETLLAASVFHNTAEAIVITDSNACFISVNPAFTEITGYSAEEIVGRTPQLLKSNHHDASFFEVMWNELLSSRGRWQGQIWNRRKDGEAFLAWQTITAVRDDRGTIIRFLSVFDDITEVHRKDEHIRHQAYHDALTGLPNRLLLQDRLGHAIEVAKREQNQVALMFIDLDRFKVVNDSLGHDVGDLLLMEITQRLNGCLRKSDTVARLGGDEFVVVVSDFDGIGEVAEVADKILRAVALPLNLKNHEVQVGASIGIAFFPQDGEDVTALMKDADTAMYRAKAGGRNTFRFFDAEMDGAAVERLLLEATLRRALANGEFELYYQPKIDLATGHVSGAEALIRWNSPERGLVAPDAFIPVAEETGLIVGIGDWVIGEACRQMAEWEKRASLKIPVAINVSSQQFLDRGFADKVSALLARHKMDPSQLEIELTESTVMAEPERAVIQFRQLREVGVTISVDDFGTGYSSLAYLKRLPLDTIKIDRSFIRMVDSEGDNAAIVRAIIALGGALGMSTIAEGVETAEEERHLRDAGCDCAQGFKYAKPLPAKQFETWLTERVLFTIGRDY
jgi:diguanylate cyclase (GGDEF)-like protein/PAS domain S-box-containing protein